MDALLLSAHLTLWLCIAVLGALVVALRAQIGALYQRIAPAGALMVNALVRAGARAPEVSVRALDGRPIQVGGPGAKSRLLLFVAPDCPVSRALLPVVRSLRGAERWVDLLLASDGGDAAAHRAFLRSAGLADVDYVLSEALGRTYGISKIPYAVLIDAEGTIASLGIVNSREHLESLFEAKELGVASIQDYLNSDPAHADPPAAGVGHHLPEAPPGERTR